ncbi:uncharacterized protein LOC112556765 isoform X2 [Pomacea canaliculata]|uniref:uncharacterized protein LOC112556765 isoform X2 n=1 Tax=Pomacea canaliculata TaxID=400727 RepID=UPI000D73E79B|nr:uncharacterized protein LOC112556765 isoform X2 [Pomacea canaliculata]
MWVVLSSAVYLNILTPTEAHGVQLSFRGKESVCSEIHVEEQTINHQVKQDYVDYCYIDLFVQNEPFAFGSYCFPFRLQLPHQIPGTFKASSKMPSRVWSASVIYQLHANIVGAETMSVSQDVVVTAVTPENIRDNHLTEDQIETFVPPGRFFEKMHVTVKLLQNYVKAGENLRFRMSFSKNCPTITEIGIKLQQILRLTVPNKSKKLDGSRMDQSSVILEDTVTTIRELVGILPPPGLQVLDNILVPLKTCDGCTVMPSVHGTFIQCNYSLEVSLHFGRQVKTLTCPIPGLLPEDNSEWLAWRPLPWLQNAEVKLGNGPITPSEHLIESEAFARLPGFQDI